MVRLPLKENHFFSWLQSFDQIFQCSNEIEFNSIIYFIITALVKDLNIKRVREENSKCQKISKLIDLASHQLILSRRRTTVLRNYNCSIK